MHEGGLVIDTLHDLKPEISVQQAGYPQGTPRAGFQITMYESVIRTTINARKE